MSDTPSDPSGWPSNDATSDLPEVVAEPSAFEPPVPAAPPATQMPAPQPPPAQSPVVQPAPGPTYSAPPYPEQSYSAPTSTPPPYASNQPPPPAQPPPPYVPGAAQVASAPYAGSQPPPPGPPPPPYAPPPSHMPPPGYPQPYPPTKSSSTKRILLIVLGVFLLLAIAIGSCTVWFVSTVKAPVDASNRFFAAIDDGDYNTAAAMTSPSCNNGLTAADLEDQFRGRRISYNLNNSNVSNGSSATVGGRLTIGSESSTFVTVILRKVDDNWQVCRFRR